jgi:hypothetical protein
MFEFHETTIAPLVECPTATGKSFWSAWTGPAASYACEVRKPKRRRRVETLAQDGAQYSNNPTFRKEFQRIVEGASKAGSPER